MCLIEDTGGVRYQDDVIVVKAADQHEARQKAIAHGRTRETAYRNIHAQRVRWAFERLVTLDEIGVILDGSEVHSRQVDLTGRPVPFGTEFAPETTEPVRSV